MDQLPFELKLTIIGMDLDKFMTILEQAGFEQQAKDVEEQVKEILSDTTPKESTECFKTPVVGASSEQLPILERCECEEPNDEPIKICMNCNGYIE